MGISFRCPSYRLPPLEDPIHQQRASLVVVDEHLLPHVEPFLALGLGLWRAAGGLVDEVRRHDQVIAIRPEARLIDPHAEVGIGEQLLVGLVEAPAVLEHAERA